MKRSTLVIGVAAVVGLLVVIGLAQRTEAPAAVGGKAKNAARAKSSAASKSGWFSWLSSDDDEESSAAVRQPFTKESRKRELEASASAKAQARQLRRQGGAAGAPALMTQHYPSNPTGIGMAMVGVTPALRSCYEGYGKLKEKLPEDVHVKVTIGPDPKDPSRGIVTRAATAEKALRHPEVEGCLKNAVSSLSFDRVSKPVEANLPLVFAQRK
ncbi:MAG: hypothetical protein ABW321_11825 [Polyangiales bacterium]